MFSTSSFETDSEASLLSWKCAIETGIQKGLGDCQVMHLLQAAMNNVEGN